MSRTAPEELAREKRLRRMAERQSLKLVKSARRDRLATDYGTYTIIDWSSAGHRIPGATPSVQYGPTSLDDIERWLNLPEER